jgi:hypothetical protein
MPALMAQPETPVVHCWNTPLADYVCADVNAESMRFGSVRRAANEARLAIDRTWLSVVWRELWAKATAPRYLSPTSDAANIRAFLQSQEVDFDDLLDAASLHFASPDIHRRTEPLNPDELEKLIEDDESSMAG